MAGRERPLVLWAGARDEAEQVGAYFDLLSADSAAQAVERARTARPDAVVLTESPSYDRALTLARRCGVPPSASSSGSWSPSSFWASWRCSP